MSLFSQHKEAYKELKNNAPTTGPIPEGVYIARLNEAKCDMSGDVTKYSITWDLEQSEDDPEFNCKGRKVWSNYQMKDPSILYFMKDLEKMNMNLDSFQSETELAEALHSNAGTLAKIYIKQREYNGKTYHNAYLNEFGTVMESDIGTPPSIDSEEEIPF